MFRLTPTMNSHFFPPSRFNRLIFLMEAYCVLCEVRSNFLYIVTSFTPRRPGFHPRPVYVRFVFAKLVLGQVFLRVFVIGLPLSVSFHQLHPHVAFTRTNGRSLGTFQKQFSFGSRGAFDRNVLKFFFFRGETLSWKSVCIRKALRTVKSTDVFRGFSRS